MSERSLHDASFRQLLDAAPDAVVIIDRLGRIAMVNREIERLFGWTEAELLNLSASSLEDENLILATKEFLAQHRLPPEAISFEITEAAALGEFARTVRLISEIRAAGCGVGLEDFGNGLTSFAYLRAPVVDYVKISGHYVRGVADDPVYGTLVSTVNQIGRIMGLTTIAEDVETEAVLRKLRDLEVAYAQGPGVAAPEPLVDTAGQVALPCFQRSA